jgi:hypothetical protein
MKLRIPTFLDLIFVLFLFFTLSTLQNIIWLGNRKGFNSFPIVCGSTNICNYWYRDLSIEFPHKYLFEHIMELTPIYVVEYEVITQNSAALHHIPRLLVGRDKKYLV